MSKISFETAREFRPLAPGDLLGVAWPASPAPEDEAAAGAAFIESLGFRLLRSSPGEGPFSYLAGQDESRAAELQRLMTDPGVGGVICLRGGYGSLRTAGYLDFPALAASAKPLAGFSDVTVLLCALLGHGLMSIHGPNLVGLQEQTPASQERLISLFGGRWAEAQPLRGERLAGRGEARGFLVGGNLTILAHLVGTPFQPPTKGGIVFFEEKGEELYRVDRCLSHLLAAGFFDGCRGVAVGRLDDLEGAQALDLISERLDRLDVPVLGELPFGHGPENMALLVGGQAVIDVEAGALAPAVV